MVKSIRRPQGHRNDDTTTWTRLPICSGFDFETNPIFLSDFFFCLKHTMFFRVMAEFKINI